VRYTLNPPWADKILRKNWDDLSAALGPELLPQPALAKKKAYAYYGCGSYGCVFPTSSENLVFKLTSDSSEAAFVAAALRIGKWPSGIVRYQALFQVPYEYYQDRQVYVLVREEATSVGKLTERQAPDFVRMLDLFQAWASEAQGLLHHLSSTDQWRRRLLAEASDAAATTRKRLRKADILAAEDPRDTSFVTRMKPAIRFAYSVAACDFISQWLSQREPSSFVGEALWFYLHQGLLLADVHLGNIGRVERGDESVWAITDPGHMVPLETRWLDAVVPELPEAR
jgi:hypothetical protein